MTRRQLLIQSLALSALAIAAHPALADVPPAPFVFWVERFYRAQLALRARQENRATPENQQGAEPSLSHPLRSYLTPDMQALYDNAEGRQMPAEEAAQILEGPILHEIFGQGALPNRDIRLVKVTPGPWWQRLVTKDLARVTLSINGTERVLTLAGDYDPETFNWHIADIDYGDGAGETLRDRLTRMQDWPATGA